MALDWIYEWPTRVIVLTVFTLMFISTIAGYLFASKHEELESDRAHNITNSFKASILGLVALLLGFTYSMTYSRFSERQRIVLDEANSIGTCYLRAGLLEAASRSSIREVLRRYTDIRIEYFEVAQDPESLKNNAKALDKELSNLWSLVEESARLQPDLTRNSLIVPSANEVIDLSSTREWAVRNKTPSVVIVLLSICMIVSATISGQSFGAVGRFPFMIWVVQTILVAMVLFVILDFDRSRLGFIQVDHTAFMELKDMMDQRS